MSNRGDLTQLLSRIRDRDKAAEQELFEAVYSELKNLARSRLRFERQGHTLQPTALVHEVYIRLIGSSAIDYGDRAHFFGTATRIMRNILVDHARKAQAQKKGAGATHVELNGILAVANSRSDEILAVDSALTKLRHLSPRQVMVVEMRFFAGFSDEEICEILNISPRTVRRDWTAAKAWLVREFDGIVFQSNPGESPLSSEL